MAKKRYNAPKRKILRKIWDLEKNGTSSQFDLFTNHGNLTITLTRMIMAGTITSEAVSSSVQSLIYEVWRMSDSSGAVLPTITSAGSEVGYADNPDLLLRRKVGIISKTGAVENNAVREDWDNKGSRILNADEKLIMRFAGGAFVQILSTLTFFYKQ